MKLTQRVKCNSAEFSGHSQTCVTIRQSVDPYSGGRRFNHHVDFKADFLKTTVVAGAAASMGNLPLHAERASASRLVTLGKSGVKVTRLAFGTGSSNGYVQSSLGQQEFSKLVAYAYERGIRFFETSESYTTPAMLGEALKPFPRDSYTLMTKVTTDPGADPQQRFEDMLRTSDTDYFDIMLLHWQHSDDWVETTKRWQEGIDQFQSRKRILSRGASVHGLPALRQMPGNPWLQVAMIRMNHKGTRMDGPTWQDDNNPSAFPRSLSTFSRSRRTAWVSSA